MNEKVLDMDDMIKNIHYRLSELGIEVDEALLDLIFDLEYEYVIENGYAEASDMFE